MQYDPIKRSLGRVFNTSPFLRKIFYNLLDVLLLRSWHVRKDLNCWARLQSGKAGYRILDAGSGLRICLIDDCKQECIYTARQYGGFYARIRYPAIPRPDEVRE